MRGFKLLILLVSPWLPVFSLPVAGPGACPLYDLSVPEGSSGSVRINIIEESSCLCKMQSAVAATDRSDCTPVMVLANKDSLRYLNSTFKGRMNLTTLGVTVKKAEKWLAGQYRVDTSLQGTCLARINLTVPEPRRHYGVWASLGFVAAFSALGLYVFWKRRGEGLETCNPGEERFSGLPVSMLASISQLPEAGSQGCNPEASEAIPLNGETTQPNGHVS
ncbi:uncharacterized protein LOC142823286 isoform X2 [Pelodiscus sinensis]|uniref:uncharacterized protein LOC142823286 isoform X2 n=1 Tax=Pelodiscus sinensis TaxID=13735 RepID=UPI003F6AE760